MSKKMTQKEFDELLNCSVESEKINLPSLVYLPLQRNGINTIYDVITFKDWGRAGVADTRYTENELKRVNPNIMYHNGVRNFGGKCFYLMQTKLQVLGLDVCPIDKEPSEWIEELRAKLVQKDIENQEEKFNDLMKTTVEKLDLSVRSWALLDRAGKETIEDVIKMTNEELCQVRNINKSCVKEIISAIRSIGLDIRTDGFGEEEWIEYLKAEFKEQTGTQEPKTTNETNRKGLIAKLLEIWNEDIEKEVQDIIDRNI